MTLTKYCLGSECEVAKNCRYHVRKTHPNDIIFMSSTPGKQCHTYEPLHEDSERDND